MEKPFFKCFQTKTQVAKFYLLLLYDYEFSQVMEHKKYFFVKDLIGLVKASQITSNEISPTLKIMDRFL